MSFLKEIYLCYLQVFIPQNRRLHSNLQIFANKKRKSSKIFRCYSFFKILLMPILHKFSKRRGLYRGVVQKWFYVKIPYGKFSQNCIRPLKPQLHHKTFSPRIRGNKNSYYVSCELINERSYNDYCYRINGYLP